MQVQSLTGRRALADYLDLTKPGITLMVLFTTLAGLWLASRGIPPLGLTFFALLGTGLASAAAATFNNLLDRDLDATMERTRDRPLPAGRLRPAEALALGVSLTVASLTVLSALVNLLSAFLALLAIFAYVAIYTAWLKRSTPLGTVFGGVVGAIPPMIGWTAVTGQIDAGALVLFAILFLWQPPHFWALALLRTEEYRAAGLPMLPVVRGPEATWRQIVLYIAALLPVSLLLYPLGLVGLEYVLVAKGLGLGFLIRALRARAAPPERRAPLARGLFLYSLLYLAGLTVAMLLSAALRLL
jgi:protoheme IX farnesyltransferase